MNRRRFIGGGRFAFLPNPGKGKDSGPSGLPLRGEFGRRMRNDPGRDSLDAWKSSGRAGGCLQRAASIAGDDHVFLWRDPDFCGGALRKPHVLFRVLPA